MHMENNGLAVRCPTALSAALSRQIDQDRPTGQSRSRLLSAIGSDKAKDYSAAIMSVGTLHSARTADSDLATTSAR